MDSVSAAGFHTAELFFTDDSGVYLFATRDAGALVDPATEKVTPELMVERHRQGGWMFDEIDRFTMLGASGHPEVPGRLDLDFYDRFFKPGAYLRTHAEHMQRWHGERQEG